MVTKKKHTDIWVIADHSNGELEDTSISLIAEAQRLAKDYRTGICLLMMGKVDIERVQQIDIPTEAKFYIIDNEFLYTYDTNTYLKVLAGIVNEYHPLLLLFADTAMGRDLAPRLSARLKIGLVTNCKLIRYERNYLAASKGVYDDQLYSDVVYLGQPPYAATLDSSELDTYLPNKQCKAEIVRLTPYLHPTDIMTNVLSIIKGNPRSIDLSQAQVIVAGGRGILGSFELVEELADVLGASVGCTRPVIDEGFLSLERQIGQTGKTVSPKLYIACGISGATHHLAGIKNAKIVIAINCDPKAPIFKIANMKVVGDARRIIPSIIAQIQTRRQLLCSAPL